jgi:hypothetical protein
MKIKSFMVKLTLKERGMGMEPLFSKTTEDIMKTTTKKGKRMDTAEELKIMERSLLGRSKMAEKMDLDAR